MHLFYTPDIKSDLYCLNEQESKHCIKVMRLTTGANIVLIDGVGNLHHAHIVDPHYKRCVVQVTEVIRDYEKRAYSLHIAIAPTKNIDRFEWFLEKATEIGVDEITPLLTQRSERKVIKTERLNKIITAAMKQSLKAFHPKLNDLTMFSDFVSQQFDSNQKLLIAHCEDSTKETMKMACDKKDKITILIGPEGDFSLSEIKEANEKGFMDVTLGNSRLRTETAGVVAAHSLAFIYE